VADKVIDIDLGTSQAQGGLTAHGDEVFALPTIEASMFDIADLLVDSLVNNIEIIRLDV
jgi:hypothetical protein